MTVPDGFRVDLVASEPLIRQPVAIDFDNRGRLWCIQYLQYPNPEGLKRVKVDRYSRTEYDRIPDPPPRGPRGADRLTILEDTDGDGRIDAAKDFVNGLNLTTGFAFGEGGVFVLNVPYLLFYPDRNGDDVPDSDPEVCLTGFGMQDAHSVANSLTCGPDGWLYGCQGSTVTANIRGIEFQQGVWRYHPRTKAFELFCEGGGNSWGLDFNTNGDLFYSTNYGGNVMLHGIQGAYLWKAFGKHGALHNPYAFGYYDHVPHKGLSGGHVTAGGIVYSGTTFPAEFRGVTIAADLLGHAVRWHTISPQRTSVSTTFGGNLLVANDTWFAPCDVTQGPDGAVYVADWHDQRTAHPDPDADWDRTNGRIYRIQWKGSDSPKQKPVDPGKLSIEELESRRNDRDGWTSRRVRQELAARHDVDSMARLRKDFGTTMDASEALQDLWALAIADRFDLPLARQAIQHSNEVVRAWGVRLAGDSAELAAALAPSFHELATSDPSPRVRLQLACTAKRMSSDAGVPVLLALMERSEDAGDPLIPLSLWWGVEQHAIAGSKSLLERVCRDDAAQLPLIRDVILPRLIQRYAAEGTEESLTACEQILTATTRQPDRQRMLEAFEAGLRLIGAPAQTGLLAGDLLTQAAVKADAGRRGGGRTDRAPPSLIKLMTDEWSARRDDPVRTRIAIRLMIDAALQSVLEVAKNRQGDTKARVASLGILEELGDSSAVEPLMPLLHKDEPEPVRIAALQVLSRFSNDAIAPGVLGAYGTMSAAVRHQARELLFGRKATVLSFLSLVGDGKIDPKEVSVEQVRRIALHGDKEIDSLVRKFWGNVRAGTPEEKLAEVRRLSNDLRAAPGHAAAGRELFRKHCASCHELFGDGRKLGPELTHANRKDQTFLLTSLVDPSAQIRKEFLSYVVQTTDGRVLTGLIINANAASITLADGKNEPKVIPRELIDEMNESPASLMPEELYRQLKPQDLRDLFDYLSKEKPLGG
jgi:putative membrane-bound dehydrogenase-like protein